MNREVGSVIAVALLKHHGSNNGILPGNIYLDMCMWACGCVYMALIQTVYICIISHIRVPTFYDNALDQSKDFLNILLFFCFIALSFIIVLRLCSLLSSKRMRIYLDLKILS